MIYLASNYSHPDAVVRELRYRAALDFTQKKIAKGIVCFSPIVYGRAMEEQLGTDYLSWKTFNDGMMQCCAEVWVLRLPGWRESRGVAYEIDYAFHLGKPVIHIPYLMPMPAVAWRDPGPVTDGEFPYDYC